MSPPQGSAGHALIGRATELAVLDRRAAEAVAGRELHALDALAQRTRRPMAHW
jgi:hypothetical protein